jgi:hypothetical protein
MKKLILCLGLSMIYAGISAQQPYKPCLDDGIVRWSIYGYHVAAGYWTSIEMAAYGDTLINNHFYKKMYLLGEFNLSHVSEDNEKWKSFQPDLPIDRLMHTYIRESEDAAKMYIYDTLREKEYLISDLNLQKGDILAYYNAYDDIYRYVADSVYIKNGMKHIRLYSIPETLIVDTFTLIEGVSPMIWDIGYIWGGKLNCFQNQSVFYKRENPDCWSWWGECSPCGYREYHDGIKDIVTINLTIVVKEEQIKILFSEKESVWVSFYDLSGRLCYSGQFSSNECVIETKGFSKGMYLLKVFHIGKNKISVNKIII